MEISSSPGLKNLASRGPTALGRTKFFALGLIFEAFSTLGMKKFPYLKTGPFGNPIFLFEFIYVQNLFFSVKSSCALVNQGKWYRVSHIEVYKVNQI